MRPWGARAWDEAGLIRQARRGSGDAIEALVRRHWDGAHRAAYLIVHDAAAAEDIAQEAMLAAVRSIDSFDRRRPFRPWLHRIVVNRSLDWLRARVFAKPFGFLNDAAAATRYRTVTGFARTKVRRVQVSWRDRSGGRHDADVQLTQVPAGKLEKLESAEPFGWWIAFVPRSAGHRPIDVTAYGEDGSRLGDVFTLRRP